jgi:hypothetical protein
MYSCVKYRLFFLGGGVHYVSVVVLASTLEALYIYNFFFSWKSNFVEWVSLRFSVGWWSWVCSMAETGGTKP